MQDRGAIYRLLTTGGIGMTRKAAPAVVLGVVLATLTQAAPADAAFCSDLNAVIADAGNQFASLRGTPRSDNFWQANGGPTNNYTATRSLPGASNCMVENDPSNQTYPWIYTCAFAAAPTKVDALNTAAGEVADCIGKTDDSDVDIDAQSDVGNVDFDRPNYEISLVASDTQAYVRFIVFPK
jgi:hypothetical protein